MKKRYLSILLTLVLLITCLAPMAAMATGANPDDVVDIVKNGSNLEYKDSQGVSSNFSLSGETHITIAKDFCSPEGIDVALNGVEAASISFRAGMKLKVEYSNGVYNFTVTHVYIKGKVVDADNNKVTNATCTLTATGGSAQLKVSDKGEFATSVDVGENSRPTLLEVTAPGYTTFTYTFTDEDMTYGKIFDGRGTIKITPDIANAEVSPIEDQAWTGSKITPMPASVKFNGKTLKFQADYAVGYKNNTDPGVATITLTGNGSYGGTKNVTFNIVAPNVPVTGVELKPAELDLKVGESAGLTATVQPSNATDKTVTFKSSDEQVATVSENGKVTAVAAGTATVTVTTKDGEFTGTCKITVTAPATGVELDKEALELKAGQSEELKATVQPDGADQTVTWKSSDEKVATVSAEGKVTAVAVGEATITVTANDGSFEATCKVNVECPGHDWKVEDGISICTICGFKCDHSDECVYEQSEDKDQHVLICNYCGYVIKSEKHTFENGECKYCSAPEKKLTSITLNQSKVTLYLKKGETIKTRLFFSFEPEDATNPAVNWKSSDEKIARVTKKGTILAEEPGSVVITGKAKDGSGVTATCKVTVKKILIEKISLPKDLKEQLEKDKYLNLKTGEKYEMKVNVSPSKNLYFGKLGYHSSNEKVFTVDGNGVITAVGAGKATLKISTRDGSKLNLYVKIQVKAPVVKVKKLSLSKDALTMKVGGTKTLKVTVSPDSATNKKVTWKSSNKNVATVDANGKITAVKKGTCTITCTAKDGSGKKATCKITVK